MSNQSPALRLDFDFAQTPDQRGVLKIKASSQLNRGVFIFNLIILSLVIPTVDWNSDDLSRFYIVAGFAVFSTLLFGIVSSLATKAFTGELVIEGKSHTVRVREGLSTLPWKELALPEQGTLITDAYHIRGHKARQYTYYRLWMMPEARGSALFQNLARTADRYRNEVFNNPPELPANAVRVFVTDDDTVLRILAESISKVMHRDIFDFSSLEYVHRQAGQLDKPFGRSATFGSRIKPQAAVPKGIRLEDESTVVARPYSARFRFLAIAFSFLVALVLSLFAVVAAKSAIGLLSPLVLLMLLLLSLTTVTELSADQQGITVTPRAFGMIRMGKGDFIRWNELEEVKVKKVAGRQGYRLELVSDRQRILVNLHSEEQAQWLVGFMEEQAKR